MRSEETFVDEDALCDPKYELQFTPRFSEFDSVPWRDADGYDKDDFLQDLDAALQNFARNDATTKRKQVVAAVLKGNDGQHVDDTVGRTGVSRQSVYRVAETFVDVFEIVKAKASFMDGVLRDRFEDLLSTFEDVTLWVHNQVQSLTERDSRDLAETTLGRWARNNMATISESADGLLVKVHDGRPLDRVELTKLLREGYEAARVEGFETALRFVENSTVVWFDYEGNRHESSGIIRTSNA